MTDLDGINSYLNSLLSSVSPVRRTLLMRQIAGDLRNQNRARIQAQRNPDGSSFPARKPQRIRGRISRRKAMFVKLRTNRFLRVRASTEGAEIGFRGRAAAIAKTHHEGGFDIDPNTGARISYPKRSLLGLPDEDVQLIERRVAALFQR